MNVSLDELRQRIDDIDGQILTLLNERAKCGQEVGKVKQAQNAVIYVPEREKAIFKNLMEKNPGPLPGPRVPAPQWLST